MKPFISLVILLTAMAFVSETIAECIVTVTDTGCDGDHDCISTDKCTGENFTVPATGYYCITVHAKCPSDRDCQYCRVCANVYQGTTRVVNSNAHRTNCGSLDCSDDICEHGGRFLLQANVTYTLYACLSPCDGSSCSDCPTNCKAMAAVHPESGDKCEIQ